MLAPANSHSQSITASGEILLGTLLGALQDHTEKELVFVYGRREVLPGYHVTEIKSGRFESLDCGANPEAWHETFIQLWDVPETGPTHMPVGKFLAIIRKVDEALPLDDNAKLTFEVSDGASPMQLYKAERLRPSEHQVRVELLHRSSSCKPRDRWLEDQKAAASCNSGTNQRCCG